MQKLRLAEIKNVLCIGAHADDIEVGCGGTILRLLEETAGLAVFWVTLGARGQGAREASSNAEAFLKQASGSTITIKEYRDSRFLDQRDEIKSFFHELEGKTSPDLILTHRLEDRHQDHRVVAELTWCAFRDHLILEYEIPKYDGDIGSPNLFIPLGTETCQEKVRLLVDSYPSRSEEPWFTEDLFWATLRARGIECNSPTGHAEGFHCRKMVI